MKLPPPQPPKSSLPRLTTKSLPPYRYIPGINKHPVRDPEGHSYGREHATLAFLAPEKWRKNHEYLFGVDLYNAAYWWESHEAWENVWHTTDKQGPYGQFLQGLIQISAAFIKWYSHEEIGMRKLYELGIMRLEFVCDRHVNFMGLDLNSYLLKLKKHFAPVLAEAASWPDPLKDYPFIILE
jgi:predicted metal-dependent hydrolase